MPLWHMTCVTNIGSLNEPSVRIEGLRSKSFGVQQMPRHSFSSVVIVGAVLHLTISPKYLELMLQSSDADS